MNVKLNDNVMVITGKYAGKQGKVTSTSPKTNKVVVAGVNIHKKSKKARKANEVSQIIEMECPIDASNVMVICPACAKPVRVKYNVEGKEKVRVCGKCASPLGGGYLGKSKAEVKQAPKKRERKRAKKDAE